MLEVDAIWIEYPELWDHPCFLNDLFNFVSKSVINSDVPMTPYIGPDYINVIPYNFQSI